MSRALAAALLPLLFLWRFYMSRWWPVWCPLGMLKWQKWWSRLWWLRWLRLSVKKGIRMRKNKTKKANSSLSSLSTATTVAVLVFFPLPFFCLGPFPPLPPPSNSQPSYGPSFCSCGIQCWSQHLGPFHPLSLRWPCLSPFFSHEQLMPGPNSVFSCYLWCWCAMGGLTDGHNTHKTHTQKKQNPCAMFCDNRQLIADLVRRVSMPSHWEREQNGE